MSRPLLLLFVDDLHHLDRMALSRKHASNRIVFAGFAFLIESHAMLTAIKSSASGQYSSSHSLMLMLLTPSRRACGRLQRSVLDFGSALLRALIRVHNHGQLAHLAV